MDKMEILKKIEEIVKEVLDLKEINLKLDSTAETIEGWDSLAHINIIGQIENEFKVHFSLNDMAEFSTMGKIIEAIQKQTQI